MVLQTIDIIKILPFDEDFKKELLESFDSFDVNKRNSIEVLLWQTYFTLYDIKLQENLEIALEEAGRNQEKLDKGLYMRVKRLTNNEMNQVSAKDIKDMDLDTTRDKLAELVSARKAE